MQIRPLFAVLVLALSASVSSAAVVTLTGTIYDKKISEPDFEDPCCSGVVTGLVSSTLNASGLPTFVGADGAGNITSASTFDNWWVDTNGSQAFQLDLAETANGSGIFKYASSSFFPIDGMLGGNENLSHNYHFTLHLEGKTSFKAGDSFTFTGDDDLWVYINGQLVMDLGGVHGAATQTITANDLLGKGLSIDTLYDLDIFFAERHTTQSNFNITTSFRVSQVPEPGGFALVGLALAAAALVRRRHP